jgi:hypothetical protein
VLTAAVATACSDSAGRRSLTGPTTLAGGTLGVQAEAGIAPAAALTAQGSRPEEVPAGETTTLTFDDITKAQTKAIHNGYGGGLQWTRLGVADGRTAEVCAGCVNGYANGRVSGEYVAYVPLGGPGEVNAPAGWTFDFISAYFTAANDRQMEVFGYRDGVQVYSQIFTINSNEPTLLTANFLDVDRVVFNSRFGTARYSELGDTFAMDNFTYRRNLPATGR